MDVQTLIGVYDADGGLLGEAAYAWGKLRGTRHCSLCDITHSRVRRKPTWDRMVAELGVPMTLLHLNELPDDVARAVAVHGAPVLLARSDDGLEPVVTGPEMAELGGSVERLGTLLHSRLAELSQ